MKINQMTVLLTGACGGIGRALAVELARAGANLYLTDYNRDGLEQLQQQLRRDILPTQWIKTDAVDLANNDELDAMIGRILQLTDPVNTLVNNAGMLSFKLFEDVSSSDIEKLMYLNSIVTMKLTHAMLPSFRTLPQARIVNIASTFGAIGFPGYSLYSASKFAVRGFSEALARELSDTGVSVGCFLPRATQTAINTSKVVAMNAALNVTMDSPELVARQLATFICSKRRFQALGWPEKLLVRLNSIFPALIAGAIEKKLPIIKQYAI